MLYNLEPNDTIVMSDSIVIKFVNGANSTCEYANYNATNWADVEIAKWICLSIVCVAFICLFGYISSKWIIKQTNCQPEKLKFRNEKNDKELKIMAELLEQKLSFYKQYCYQEIPSEENDTKKSKKICRSLDTQEVKAYITALDKEINRLLEKINYIS